MPPDGDMPNNYTLPISDLYQETYDNQWQEQIQQATSRLERFCVIKSGLTGKLQEFSFVGTRELDEKQGRMQDIVLDELDYFKRRMLPVSFSKHLATMKTTTFSCMVWMPPSPKPSMPSSMPRPARWTTYCSA